MNPDVVFLGQRGFAPEIDFDGRIRRCQILAWTTVDWGTALPCLAVNVEPAISLGGYTLTVGVLVPSEIGTLDDLKEGLAVDVDVCILQDPATLAVAPIALDKIMPFSNGVIAISEDALPLAPEQEFQRMIVLLRTYVEEHGNTDVPPNWRSDGARLGEWLSHLRLVRRTELKGHNVQVDPRWVRALEAIPGWHW